MKTLIRFLVILQVMAISVPRLTSQTLVPLIITVKTTPSPGFVYLAPNTRVPSPAYAPALLVLDSAGLLVASKFAPEYPFDLRVLPDGRLGYSVFQAAGSGPRASSSVFIVDSTLTTRDSLKGGNGYNLAMHSFQVLPNGNRLLILQEDVIMDMSKIVAGGNPAASVQQMLIQEVDITGRVIFQWRSLDHFPVTVSYEDVTAPSIRYFHLNAVWVDDDGNLLISARHSSLVAKIDRRSGEVLWVLGGKLNQFTFSTSTGITDPPEFSYQHDIRRLPNGHITLFDNGTQRLPQWSRGVEYEIDEVAKTCKLVWQYRRPIDVYTGVQGSMQTLPDGHRLLAWGSGFTNNMAFISEVDENGIVVLEAHLPNTMYPYKAEKNVYPPGRHTADVLIDEILPTNTYTYTRGTDTVGLTITYHTLISFFYNTTTAKRYQWSPENPSFVIKTSDLAPVLPPMVIHPCRVTLTQEGMVEHAGEFRFNSERLRIALPQQVVVYYRDSIGKGPFRPLRTRFNPSSRELVVDTASAGEFCFGSPLPGLPGSILAPRLLAPIAGASVLTGRGVPLRISPQGISSSCTYVVERASGLDNVHTITRPEDKDTTLPLIPGVYRWKAAARITSSQGITATTSLFTVLDSFIVEGPFLRITSPMSGVAWTQDSSYVVAWNTNLVGLARIELVKDDQVVAIIRDNVNASSGGYLWKVPVTLPIGTGYAVRVRTLEADPTAASAITEFFVEIREILTSVDDHIEMQPTITMAPNPASSQLFIGGSENILRVMIFSHQGELALDHTTIGTGDQLDIRTLSSGLYFVRIFTVRGSQTQMLSIIR